MSTKIEIGDLCCLVDLCCQKMRNRHCGWIGPALETFDDWSAIINCVDGQLLFNYVRFIRISLFDIPLPEFWLQKLRPHNDAIEVVKSRSKSIDDKIEELADSLRKQGYIVEVL